MSGYLVLSISRWWLEILGWQTLAKCQSSYSCGVVDQHMAAAEHVMQLRDLQAVPFQVGHDRGFLWAQPRDRGQQPLAVLPGLRSQLDQQPDPGLDQLGLIGGQRLGVAAPAQAERAGQLLAGSRHTCLLSARALG